MRTLRPLISKIGLPLAIFAFLAIGVTSFFVTHNLGVASKSVVESQRALEFIAGLHSSLAEIDRAATGFALTGGESFLPLFDVAKQEKDRQLAGLREYTRADPTQSSALNALEPLLARRCATAEQMIRVRREQGPEAARQIVLNSDTRNLTDQILTSLTSMQGRESEVLASRREKAERAAGFVHDVNLLGLIIGIALVGTTVRLLTRNIQARQETEKALAEEHALTCGLIDNIPDSVYVKDAKGRFKLANRIQRKTLAGDEKAQLENKTVYDFANPMSAEEQDRDDQSVIRARRPFIDRVERSGTPGDKNAKWFLTTKVPLFNAEGEFTNLLGIHRDITAMRKLQDELQQAKSFVESASRAKTDFLANMSHEIRTPMNGILGMIELGLDTDLTPQQHEYLSLCKNSAQSLLDLLNDILDFSRGESGTITLENIPFDLREVISQVITPLTSRAYEKQLRLTWHCGENVPRWLRGDPARLRQVLVNLVGNAIKFTDRGEVFLQISQESGKIDEACLKFSLSDTGIGIPDSKREEIFKAFSQADTSHTRHYGGTGLGLTIASRLVTLMGGRIWLDSEVDKGSTFYFTAIFGLSEEIRPAKAAEPLPVAQQSPSRGFGVLVVDPDFTSCRVLEDLLLSWQMKPKSVASGPTALDELWQAFQDGNPFPLVLIDPRMSGMDGLELARLIKREPELQATRIILISSAPELIDGGKVREIGIDAVFPKPLPQKELLEEIHQIFGGTDQSQLPFAWGSGAAALTSAANASAVSTGAPVPQTATPVTTADQQYQLSTPLTVLVAEDNPVNQAVAVGILSKRGHQCLRANNGVEAVAMFEKHQIDVILMDIQMPEMDGHAAVKQIRRIETGTGRHIPIIAVTAHAMKGDRERCLASGMDAYVSKPFPKEELVRLVESYGVQSLRTDLKPEEDSPAAPSAAAAPPVAPVAQAQNKTVVYSREQLVEELGDEDLVKTLIDIFLDQTPKLLKDLDSALEAKDATLTERTAHSIKGSSGNFGAKNAWQLAQAVEYAGRSGDLASAADSTKQLNEELRLVMAALGEMH